MNRHDTTTTTRRLLLTAVAWTAACLAAMAQNNPYKIHDSLYPTYVEAYRSRISEKGLALAQRLYDEAKRIGDKKAMCLALTVRMQHQYFNDKSGTLFNHADDELMAFAKKTGYRQYYFFGITNRVQYLLNQGNSYAAYRYAEQFVEQCRKGNDFYGIFYALDCLGTIHAERKEVTLAINAYREAIEIGIKYVKDQDLGTVYRKLADCYGLQFDYRRMYDTAKTGYAVARTNTMRMRMLRHMAFAQLKMQDYDGVEKCYRLYVKANGGPVNTYRTDFINSEMVVMHGIATRDFDKARHIIDSIYVSPDKPRNVAAMRLEIELFRRQGDMKGLATVRQVFYNNRIAMQDAVSAKELLNLNAQLYNQRLEIDNRQLAIAHQQVLNERQRSDIANANLELDNTRLSLRNSSLELSHTKADADRLRLATSNKHLETDRLRSKMKEESTRHRTFQLYAGAAVIVVLVMIVGGIYLLRLYRRVTRRLKLTHKQLADNYRELREARNRAVAADKAKAAVLHNMTRDINIPLNAITGFSTLIAERDRTYTPDERREFFKQIHSGTDQLLRIVGDALEKAQSRTKNEES